MNTSISIDFRAARDYLTKKGYNADITTEENVLSILFSELKKFGITPDKPVTEFPLPRTKRNPVSESLFSDMLQELRNRISLCRSRMADEFTEWAPRLDELRNIIQLAERLPHTEQGYKDLSEIIREQAAFCMRSEKNPESKLISVADSWGCRADELMVISSIVKKYQNLCEERMLSVFAQEEPELR